MYINNYTNIFFYNLPHLNIFIHVLFLGTIIKKFIKITLKIQISYKSNTFLDSFYCPSSFIAITAGFIHYLYNLIKIFRRTFALSFFQHDSYMCDSIWAFITDLRTKQTHQHQTHSLTLSINSLFRIYISRLSLFEPQPFFSSLLCLMIVQ